jgi:gamma-glutamyltranspeptidase/glutathione hydrolase
MGSWCAAWRRRRVSMPSSRLPVLPSMAVALPLLGVLACRPATPGTGIGVVAAPTPEAAQAGVLVMEAGGNAIDAAVAISFALGVTEPAMSGLGGQTQILLDAPGAEPILINGTSFAPAATPAGATAEDVVGYRATTVPTTVRVLDFAWRRFGSGRMAWADLLTPAIRFAERGFVPGPFRRRVWEDFAKELAANPAARRFFLLENGRPPGRQAFTQPDLAATLRRIARDGADDFYRGEIAREIAADMEANGGWLTLADLEGLPEPTVLPALESRYRGYRVYTAPPPAGGWVVLRVLDLLNRRPALTLDPGRSERIEHLARTLRLGHRERRDEPVRDLVDYGPEVRAKLGRSAIDTLGDGDGQTTHFSVVDPDGMVVAVTASINYGFGAKVANATLGFLYNDYMREFVLGDPDHPYALRAGAMPYSSMSPTVVERRGSPVLALGSPGSARIISAVVQVGELWMDGFARIEEAVAMPRIHVVPDSALFLEDPAVADSAALERAGFILAPPRADGVPGALNAYFGGVHAVAFERGEWTGAADPRRDGVVRRTRPVGGPVP